MRVVNHLLIAVMFGTPLQPSFSFFDITAKFKNQFKDLFGDIDPIPTAPANQNIPPDIPRYLLQTNDNKNAFSFSGIRFDYNFYRDNITLEDIREYVRTVESGLNDLITPKFRIGLVIEGTFNILNEPDDFIKEYIISDKMSDAIEWQLSYRKILSKKGYNYNEWVRFFVFKNNPIVNFSLDVNSIDEITNGQILLNYDGIISERFGDFIGC